MTAARQLPGIPRAGCAVGAIREPDLVLAATEALIAHGTEFARALMTIEPQPGWVEHIAAVRCRIEQFSAAQIQAAMQKRQRSGDPR